MPSRARQVLLAATLASLAGAIIATPQGATSTVLASFDVQLKKPHRAAVVRYSGTASVGSGARVTSRGRLRISPKLCAGTYRLRITSQTIKGDQRVASIGLKLAPGRRDSRARRCPLADLPRRGFESLRVSAFVNGTSLLRFVARPSTRRRDPYAPLDIGTLTLDRRQVPSGHITMQIRAVYAHRSYIAHLSADTTE